MTSLHQPFQDREDTGRRLAGELDRHRDSDPVILALPRGGVPVGYEMARGLNAPLDVMVSLLDAAASVATGER